MTDNSSNSDKPESISAARDLSKLAAGEIVGLHGYDLATACAVKLGLYEGTVPDLAEARILIEALGGLVDGGVKHLGSHHAAPLRDALSALQKEFRRQSLIQDEPGDGPAERYTGYVAP